MGDVEAALDEGKLDTDAQRNGSKELLGAQGARRLRFVIAGKEVRRLYFCVCDTPFDPTGGSAKNFKPDRLVTGRSVSRSEP